MKTQNPLIGRSTGSFASSIFQTQYGMNIVRSKPVEVRNPKTPAQVAQREKFNLVQSFITAILTLIRTGFAGYKSNMSAYSAAMGYYLSNCIAGTAGSFSIDYPNAIFSSGDLLLPSFGTVCIFYIDSTSNQTHTDNSGTGNALSSDIINIICYNVDKDSFYTTQGVRNVVNTTIDIQNTNWEEGDTVKVWAFLTSADSSLISDTVFIGTQTVEAV